MRCRLKKAVEREDEARRLLEKHKNLRREETQIGKEKGLNYLKLSLQENDKGKPCAQG